MFRMTRETTVGLLLAGAFVLTVAGVLGYKLHAFQTGPEVAAENPPVPTNTAPEVPPPAPPPAAGATAPEGPAPAATAPTPPPQVAVAPQAAPPAPATAPAPEPPPAGPPVVAAEQPVPPTPPMLPIAPDPMAPALETGVKVGPFLVELNKQLGSLNTVAQLLVEDLVFRPLQRPRPMAEGGTPAQVALATPARPTAGETPMPPTPAPQETPPAPPMPTPEPSAATPPAQPVMEAPMPRPPMDPPPATPPAVPALPGAPPPAAPPVAEPRPPAVPATLPPMAEPPAAPPAALPALPPMPEPMRPATPPVPEAMPAKPPEAPVQPRPPETPAEAPRPAEAPAPMPMPMPEPPPAPAPAAEPPTPRAEVAIGPPRPPRPGPAARIGQPEPEGPGPRGVPVLIKPQPDLPPENVGNVAMNAAPPRGRGPRVESYPLTVHRIQPGDTFAGISTAAYGSDRFQFALAAYNRDLNPDLTALQPGRTLEVPAVEVLRQRYPATIPAGAEPRPVAVRAEPARLLPTVAQDYPAGLGTPVGRSPQPVAGNVTTRDAARADWTRNTRPYRVKDGDTIWTIAQRTLGAGERWPEISRLNRDVLPDVSQLRAGMNLRLPAEARVDAADPSP